MEKNPVLKFMENSYMATDDYFKMSGFIDELETLKNARPNASIDVLEKEAADIIQNTIPNYDRVSKGLKKLNYLLAKTLILNRKKIILKVGHEKKYC